MGVLCAQLNRGGALWLRWVNRCSGGFDLYSVVDSGGGKVVEGLVCSCGYGDEVANGVMV